MSEDVFLYQCAILLSVIASGMLSTPKARVLLMLALAEAERQGVRDPEARVASVRRAFTHCREV